MNSLSTFVEQSEATQSFSALEPHQSRDKKTIHTADSEINVPTETFQTRKLWLRQSQALFSKNATLLKRRLHWVLIRAFVIPVIFTLYMGLSKYLYFPIENYGIAQPNQSIAALQDVVGDLFVTYYATDDSRVSVDDMNRIMNVALTGVPSSQIKPASHDEALSICAQSLRGLSACYGGIQWNDLDVNQELYNYTVRGNWGLDKVDVENKNSDVDKYVLPLQLALDNAIRGANTEVFSIPFTSITNEENKKKRDRDFMKSLRQWISPALYIAFLGVVYHLSGVVAQERELGLTNLLGSMGTDSHARIAGHVAAFSLTYLPGWIVMGVVYAVVYFKSTNAAIFIFFSIFTGFAAVTWAILLGTLFKKAQIAGIVSAGISIVLAILTSVQNQAGGGSSSPGAIYVLSFLFNPMSFCFFIQLTCYNQGEHLPLNLVQYTYNGNTYPLVVFITPIFQFYFYILLTLLAERVLYGRTRPALSTATSGHAVEISNICKTYKGSIFSFNKNKVVTAVDSLTLNISPNQIFSLLGANGSGKTTTLEIMAGIQTPTSGTIVFGPGTKLGICPQKNVLWDNLTVTEHLLIWSRIKGVTNLEETSKMLIEKCGLSGKEKTRSKNLSGGQKRKLQLAIMFTGGSNVCCIDEVSSGLDPVSRRVIWDILMAFRDTHTMILTTHFLDEADILSDNIAVLSKGILQAEGSPLHLKDSLGDGYRIFIDHTATGYEEVYNMPNPQAVLERITELEESNTPYRIAGPELEDVFLKLASKDHEGHSLEDYQGSKPAEGNDLEQGDLGVESNQVGFFKQLWALLCKRFIVFRRAPSAEIAFFAIPIIVAGACSSFLKSAKRSTASCGSSSRFSKQEYALIDSFDRFFQIPIANQQEFLASSAGFESFIQGQSSWITSSTSVIASVASNFTNSFQFIDTAENWYKYIGGNFSTVTPGGLTLVGNYSVAYQADTDNGVDYGTLVMNLFTNLLVNGTQSIVANYSPFQTSWVSSTGKDLQFSVYFGLAMAVAPAFASLYPTFEKLSNVRAMQYSNGLRVLPLWTAYSLFNLVIIIVVSAACLGIVSSAVSTIFGAGYLFLIFVLFLIAASLISFVVSLFVKSQLAAFAVAASYEAVFVLIYLIGYLTTQTYGQPSEVNKTVRIIYFTIATISPAQSLMRSIFLAFNIFGILCENGEQITYKGHILNYGGPILYLFVQIILMFSFLIWWESGMHTLTPRTLSYRLPQFFRFVPILRFFVQKRRDKGEEKELDLISEDDVLQEKADVSRNLHKFSNGLALQDVKREYDGNYVVDDISFGVLRGECFALLGPNGAGKTTTFNMIRGEVPPSSGEIFVNGISVAKDRALARTKLGVCPQFDAMDKMTVTEVLYFYAQLRGVQGSKAVIRAHVEELIHAVDLDRFRTRMASALSGGNKRKLSLAVSLIGNPDVLLLDEPSSGMDAFAKRIMWRALSEVAPGRAIVLTTHSMEEADALANRAGILARKMLALGTVDNLRNKYGDVIHVHLVCGDAPTTSAEEVSRVLEILETIFPGVKIEDRTYQGQIKVSVPCEVSTQTQRHNDGSEILEAGTSEEPSPRSGGASVAQVFRLLEEHKAAMRIRSYSVFPTRLEEVFLKIVGDYVEKHEQ